jgi:hypothetical protein
MSEDKYTPDTEDVRTIYAGYKDNYRYDVLDPGYGAEFDRWLAMHDLKTFDDGFAHGAEYGAVSRGMWPTH